MSSKILKTITQILLLSVIAIVPFLKTTSLYFPYISGKVYVFRLLVALAFFFWVWFLIKKTENKEQRTTLPFKNILVVALVLFFLAQVLVSFFGVDPLLSFFSTIERGDGVLQYGFWLLYFLMLLSVFRAEKEWKLFFSVFVIVAFLLSIYSWLNLKEQVRLYAIFGNPSYFAVFLLFAIGFSAIMIERKFFGGKFSNYLLSAAILFFIITLIFTQTRGAYVGLAGGIFLFCLLSLLFLRKENKKLALSCGIILFLGLISVIVLFAAKDTDFVKNIYILKRTASVAKFWQDDVVRERLLVWQMALKGFKEKPVFGWGPENFWSAANKYYDYRVGIAEPWFDRAHSQPIDTLTTGGIVLFSFYLFWMAAAVYLILKILKQKKTLAFILISILLAYFLQGLFLFDVLATFLGLFPFLAFLVSSTYSIFPHTSTLSQNKKPNFYILIPTACFSLFVIYATCFVPYKANASALKFLIYTNSGIYQEAKQFLEQSFNIKSPYTFWEVRKRSGWQISTILKYELDEETKAEDVEALKDIYDYIMPELERFAENRPYDPQIYYVLGRTYLLGFEKLGKKDLEKAERSLKKGLNYSDRRIEYFNELVQVLTYEEKFEEGENLIKEYSKRLSSDGNGEYYNNLILGHLYFLARKDDLAWEQYEKAREGGYQFVENDLIYSRYALLAEQRGEYQKIVDVSLAFLERWGPAADIFYNVAVGYLYLEEKEKAKEFFLKAVELKPEYEEYRPLFAPE